MHERIFGIHDEEMKTTTRERTIQYNAVTITNTYFYT